MRNHHSTGGERRNRNHQDPFAPMGGAGKQKKREWPKDIELLLAPKRPKMEERVFRRAWREISSLPNLDQVRCE
jgi:hypothetical protein